MKRILCLILCAALLCSVLSALAEGENDRISFLFDITYGMSYRDVWDILSAQPSGTISNFDGYNLSFFKQYGGKRGIFFSVGDCGIWDFVWADVVTVFDENDELMTFLYAFDTSTDIEPDTCEQIFYATESRLDSLYGLSVFSSATGRALPIERINWHSDKSEKELFFSHRLLHTADGRYVFVQHRVYSMYNKYIQKDEYEHSLGFFLLSEKEARSIPESVRNEAAVAVAMSAKDAPEPVAGNTAEVSHFSGDFTRVGNIVTMGQYEQDNDLSNGPEPIEWIVAGISGKRAWLVSRYLLDAELYWLDSATTGGWYNSEIRKWLNESFLTTAFSSEERAFILPLKVDNSSDQNCERIVNNPDTTDHVFLMSYLEAFTIFPDNESRIALFTPYAKARQIQLNKGKFYVDEEQMEGSWMIRTPLLYGSLPIISFVGGDDIGVLNSAFGVRPSMWVAIIDP